MYNIIRNIFCVIVFVVLLIIILTSKTMDKKKKIRNAIISAVSCLLILNVLIFFIPVENIFKFQSPENVYNYKYTFTDYKIVYVFSGEKSDIVISKNSSSDYNYYPVPKATDGYLIDPTEKFKSLYYFSDGDFIIELTRYEKTGEIFGKVLYWGSSERPVITDSIDSDFLEFEGDGFRYSYMLFTSIKKLDTNYSITINGKEVSLSKFIRDPLYKGI